MVAFGGCHFDASVANNAEQSDDQPNPSPDEGEVVGDCTPGDVPLCDGNNLLECSAEGEMLEIACALGCTPTSEAHCRFAVPRAPVASDAIDLAFGSVDTEASGSLVLDTDSGQISQVDGGTVLRAAGLGLDASSGIHFAIVSQPNGPDIGVFTVASVVVQTGDVLRAQGVNAFAAVSASDVLINGVIDIDGGAVACESDTGSCAGPGGNDGGDGSGAAAGDGQGPGAGQHGSDPGSGAGESGGGGGAFGTPGASGGNGLSQSNFSVRAQGGSGGEIVDDELLLPLRGGSGGGGGARENTNYQECNNKSRDGALGGGGGGALQLFSRTRIDIANGGGECGIRASGGGGDAAGCGAGGGGAGSGGALLLEAPTVDVASTCFLVANGGGGSGGHMSDAAEGGRIAAAAQASAGRFFASFPSGSGGNGCYLGTPPEAGGNSAYQAGGGGGGDGRIRLHTTNGSSFSSAGTIAPMASQGSLSAEL